MKELESGFKPLLISCLKISALGKYGLFGQWNTPEMRRYIGWPEVGQLKEIAAKIRELRAEFGQPNLLVERFYYHCSRRGPNDPGEPKLARAFLNEIASTDPEIGRS